MESISGNISATVRPNKFASTLIHIIFELFSTLGNSSRALIPARLERPKDFLRHSGQVQHNIDDPRPFVSNQESLSLPHTREKMSPYPESNATPSLRLEPEYIPGWEADIDDLVKRMIAAQFQVAVGEVSKSTALADDLGANGIELRYIAQTIWDKFACKVTNEEAENFKLVLDVINFVNLNCFKF
ncbi:uncharacterized protein LOC110855675 isoform X2 [Folsomia candida]|nr:uncharacterized protein LOC110855675 isoform X2 [Folsomia candida]